MILFEVQNEIPFEVLHEILLVEQVLEVIALGEHLDLRIFFHNFEAHEIVDLEVKMWNLIFEIYFEVGCEEDLLEVDKPKRKQRNLRHLILKRYIKSQFLI